MRPRWLPLVLVAAGTAAPFAARAVEFNFAGTLQLDYLYTPFTARDPRPSSFVLDGFTQELSLKVAADLGRHTTANVKACFGCHGFEAGMGYVDFHLSDAFNVRVGRFTPTFGEFNLRHDPGNHRLSDKPLPYDMGRMLRFFDFGRSVLPSPYVDNGIEIWGSHFFGPRVQVSYAAHAVTGLRSLSPNAQDVDFASMRTSSGGLVIDNNSEPSVGGRLGVTFRLANRVDLSLGSSALYGRYDPAGRLQYTVLGGDLFLRLPTTNIRAEYLIRRTEMDASDPTSLAFEVAGVPGDPTRTFNTRDGWYIEVEQRVRPNLDVLLRWDGMRRVGNVGAGSLLDFDAGVSRWTLGAQLTVERGYRIKASAQHYQWWGLRNAPSGEFAVHLGAVATF